MNTLDALYLRGFVQRGDILLFLNGERGILNAGIRYAQRRALRDLDPTLAPATIAAAAQYTHCAQVMGSSLAGNVCWAEQYAPHARYRFSTELAAGQQLLVLRLRGAEPVRLEPVISHWREVVARKDPYPMRELVYYWLRWVRKTHLALRFADAFRDTRHNVCSGEVVCASQAGAWFAGERPEAWYPARLALDHVWCEQITVITVSSGAAVTTVGTAEPPLPIPGTAAPSPLLGTPLCH